MNLDNLNRLIKSAVIVSALIVIGISSARMIRSTYAKGDFEAFLHGANSIAAQTDIYSVPSRPLTEGGLYYIYLPLLAVLLLPLTLLPIEISIVLWSSVNAFLVYWITITLLKLISGENFDGLPFKEKWIVALVPILLTSRFLLHHFYYGQANVLGMAIIVLGLKFLDKRSQTLAGIGAGIATVMKTVVVPFVFWMSIRLKPRELLGVAIGILLGAIILPGLVLGFEKNWSYVSHWVTAILLDDGLGTGRVPLAVNVSIQALMYRLFTNVPAFTYQGATIRLTLTDLSSQAISWGGLIFEMLLLGVLCFYRIRFRNSERLVALWGGVALTFVITTLFAPTAQKHYFVLLLPAYIYVVYLWVIIGLKDRLFKVLAVGSVLLAGAKYDGIFGELIDGYFFALSAVSFGALLLAGSVIRAGYSLSDNKLIDEKVNSATS